MSIHKQYIGAHMEIFGCNNLVLYKVENTIDLRCFLPCCNLVNWLLTPCNNLKVITILCKDYMASTLWKLVIPIFGYDDLSVPL